MKLFRVAAMLVLMLTGSAVFAQQDPVILLWPDGAPGAKTNGGGEVVRMYERTGDYIVSNVHRPSITPYIPAESRKTGIAVIIAPGGGHRELWIDHEGYTIAQQLSEQGIAAFVLKYRLADEDSSIYTVEGHSVQDMLHAVRIVRSRASEWSVDPDKIGVMGFSAGGEVAALTDMMADSGFADAADPVDRVSGKPDFQALIYPYRSDKYVPGVKSAPAFIVCGFQDDLDGISQKMPALYLKFKVLHIPAELHIYANAGHGFGIRAGDTGASSLWLHALIAWLRDVNS